VSKRYKTQGDWEEVARNEVGDSWLERPAGIVITEQADALDTQTNNVYRGGAFRVRIEKCSLDGKPRGKTFIGESAWSLAESYHRSAVSKIIQLS
jgi:hypothetical protein